MVQPIVFRVAYDADDFEPVVWRLREQERRLLNLEHGAAHPLAYGIGAGEELLDEGLVDDGEMRASHYLRLVVDAAG